MKKRLKGVVFNVRFLVQNENEARTIIGHWRKQPVRILTMSVEEFL